MARPEKILRKLLQEIAEEENFTNYEINIEPVSTSGANYTSVLFKAQITAPGREELNLFSKVAIISEKLRTIMEADRIFEMERYFYKNLSKRYDELQDKYEVPRDERLRIPRFYGCCSDYLEETIVMENLATEGYEMFDRFKSIDWDYASKAVSEMAKLHALSFAYKKDFPEEFADRYPKMLFPIKINDEFITVWKNMTDKVISAVDDDVRPNLEAFIEKTSDHKDIQTFYGAGKWGLIVHGDYRMSNLLHKIVVCM